MEMELYLIKFITLVHFVTRRKIDFNFYITAFISEE